MDYNKKICIFIYVFIYLSICLFVMLELVFVVLLQLQVLFSVRCTVCCHYIGGSSLENTERDAHKQRNIIFAAIYRQLSYLAIICALRVCEQATFDGGFHLCCDTEP